MQTLPQRLLQLAREAPEATACWSKVRGLWRRTTWREAATRTMTAASALAQGGVAAGDCVLLLGDAEPDLQWAALGILSLGAVVVPADPATGAPQLGVVLEGAGVRHAVLRDEEQAAKLIDALAGRGWRGGAWCWRDEAPAQLRGLPLRPLLPAAGLAAKHADAITAAQAQDATAPAFIGTTHAQLWDQAMALQQQAGLIAGQRLFCAPPLAYEAARSAWALSLALPLAGCFAESPDQLESCLRELQPEISLFDAAYWDELAAALSGRVRGDLLSWAARGKPGGLADRLVRRPLHSRLGLRDAVAVLACGPQDGRARTLLATLGVRWIAVDDAGSAAGIQAPADAPLVLQPKGACA